MSQYGNYQIAVNCLSNILNWKDRIKNEKKLFRKIKLWYLFKKKLAKKSL